jgi:hypothetical protein
MQINFTLSSAETKALESSILDVQDWAEYIVKERARIEIENIVNNEIQRKLAVGETISGTKEEIVLAADIQTIAEKNATMEIR